VFCGVVSYTSAGQQLPGSCPERGDTIVSRLELVEEVGLDEDGDRITSCVVVPSETPAATENATKLTQNQRTFFDVLARAGRPLSAAEWTELGEEAGLSFKASKKHAAKKTAKAAAKNPARKAARATKPRGAAKRLDVSRASHGRARPV
jgi:hypothetical protein